MEVLNRMIASCDKLIIELSEIKNTLSYLAGLIEDLAADMHNRQDVEDERA